MQRIGALEICADLECGGVLSSSNLLVWGFIAYLLFSGTISPSAFYHRYRPRISSSSTIFMLGWDSTG